MKKYLKKANVPKELLKEIQEQIQLEECFKNKEFGISKVDNIKVIVFYKTPKRYKVKIIVPKSCIGKDAIIVKNSMFNMFLDIKRTSHFPFNENIVIKLKGKYNVEEFEQKRFWNSNAIINLRSRKYFGTIILQPQFFIPEELFCKENKVSYSF